MGILFLGFILGFIGCAPALAQEAEPASQSGAAQPLASPPGSLNDYVIGPQDLLSISILESPDLSREVRVAADGTISMPLLAERLRVGGLTLGQAEEALRHRYQEGGILNQPNITVSLKELQSKPVTVTGAVRSPGVFQVNGPMRLLRLLSLAGGFGDEAGMSVQVIREDETGKTHIEEVKVEDLREGQPEANVIVRGGDTVNVRRAGSVYVVGAVNHPGRFLLRGDVQQTTILNLLAMAEDLKRTAKPDHAVLLRKQGATKEVEQIPVDIRKILERKQPDIAVESNDVLYVPDSTAKRAFTRGLEAAVQVASGLALFAVRP